MIVAILFASLTLSPIIKLSSLKLSCSCKTPVSCHANGYYEKNISTLQDIVFIECENLIPSAVSDLHLSWMSEGTIKNLNQFENLKTLTVTNSVLKSLKHELFKGLNNMEKLILNRNEIIEMSDFLQLKSLKKIFLASNKVSVIRKNTFYKLFALTFLSVEDNKIFFIHPDAFTLNENLEELNLNRNDLTFLEPTTFHSNKNLKEVSLNHNSLKRLSVETFIKNEKLETLRLFGNKLKSLKRNIFENNKNLRWIELGGNELFYIDTKVFQNLQKLEFVDVSLNDCIDGSFPIEMDYQHFLELIKRNCHYLAVLNN